MVMAQRGADRCNRVLRVLARAVFADRAVFGLATWHGF